MNFNLILVIMSYILFAGSIVAIPIKRKNVMKLTGKSLITFPKKKFGYFIAVDIVAFILITILFFIRYSGFVSLVLCGCGVLGAWIIVGEAALGPIYGLYENGFVASGKFIPFDDIVTYPVFNLPKSEQKNHPDNVLVIASKRYGNMEILFDSAEICSQVVAKLKELGKIK